MLSRICIDVHQGTIFLTTFLHMIERKLLILINYFNVKRGYMN